jgi:predicted RNase H-like HicB family nuclease
MPAVYFDTYSDARAHLKELLDAAERGRPATLRRDAHRSAVVEADRLRHYLACVRPAGAELVAEAGGWSAYLTRLRIAADGATADEAIDELVVALREYAEDWADHLADAPNHAAHWGLVHLVVLSDDGQLHDWLVASDR